MYSEFVPGAGRKNQGFPLYLESQGLTLFLIVCPIPAFDHNEVIPPHLGNPASQNDLSPYPCSIMELCTHFATTTQRIEILKGYVNFRRRMTTEGIIHGFQWLDGSFLENIEVSEKRPPNDLDLITLYANVPQATQQNILNVFPEFANATLSKQGYRLDHYPFDISIHPAHTVEFTRYWVQLFSHKKSNGIWKGMLQLPINTDADDVLALDYLNNLVI